MKSKTNITGPVTPTGKWGEGLYRQGNARKTSWFFVWDGVLHVPISWMGNLAAIVGGYKITQVDKHTFVRAADVIKERPSLKEDIEGLAERRGVRL